MTSDETFLINMRKFDDPNDSWTRLMVFGSVHANNVGRSSGLEFCSTLKPVLHQTLFRTELELCSALNQTAIVSTRLIEVVHFDFCGICSPGRARRGGGPGPEIDSAPRSDWRWQTSPKIKIMI